LGIGEIWEFRRKVETLLTLEGKHGAAIETLRAQVADLEHERDKLPLEIRAVATQTASVTASQHIADLSRRIGALEQRARGG
jgi:prefoldin subunit 5